MNNENKKILPVGTRGSLLAVTQTHLVLDMIKAKNEGIDFEVKTIKTSGDEGKEVLGAFVKEVEIALRSKEINIAIHSLKDMPTALPEGVFVASVPTRGEHRDCLISRDHIKFEDLPKGAKIGTSSLRRIYQLRDIRPDLQFVTIRGNIITRMGKIDTGEVDAVILAAAGLERVQMADKITQIFTEEQMLPAVAQGILAIEVRDDDAATIDLVRSINDENTMFAADAERAFLTGLGGGCRMPIAAYARVDESGEMLLDGMVYAEDGSKMEKGLVSGKPQDAKELGRKLSEELLQKFGKKPFSSSW
ncbi:MAG: hydroxymethylbilane synthase [Bacteroidia bacterium]